MAKSSLKLSTVLRRFKELRLKTADSIVRNNEDIRGLLKDIETQSIANELLDEYSIRYLLLWMSTKCGLFRYSTNIDSCDGLKLNSFSETGWYPFLNEIHLKNEAAIQTSIFEYLDCSLPKKLEYLGLFYEFLNSHSLEQGQENKDDIHLIANTKLIRRNKGQFYTPPDIVRFCLTEALTKDSIDLIKKLEYEESISGEDNYDIQKRSKTVFKALDPALGSGNFLAGILAFAKELGLSDKALVELASNCLYGIDIDGRAVSVARFSLLLKLLDLVSDSQVVSSNLKTLMDKLGENLALSDSTITRLVTTDSNPKFNLVITNPPYVSFGSRDQQVIPESLSSLYKKYYPNSSEYKIRLNSIFHDVASRYTDNQGVYALLVPDSFLTGRRYAKLRQSIIEDRQILSLTELPDNTIQNATVGRWCLAVIKNQRPPQDKDYTLKTISFCDKSRSTTSNTNTESVLIESDRSDYQLPLSRLISSDHQRLQLVFNQFDDHLIQLLGQMPRLKSVLKGHTGIRSRIGQKKIIASSKEQASFRKGITSGSSVKPFSTKWTGSWLDISKEKLYSGGFDPLVIENNKILVRQTSDSVIASFDDSGLYHLNNVHSFSKEKLKDKSKSNFDLFIILAWMNSNLWKYIYRLKTREDGRALAQIDIETVEEMPIPEEVQKEILGAQLALSKLLCETKEEKNLSLRQAATRCLNRLVYAAYEISEEKILYIEEDLKHRMPSKNLVSTIPLTSVEEALKISQSLYANRARKATFG